MSGRMSGRMAGGMTGPTTGRTSGRPDGVVVLDLGIGNLGNLVRALERLGVDATVSADPARLVDAEVLFLPGVGAFQPARQALRGRLEETLRAAVARGAWLFGICLGYQLLFASSDEDVTSDLPPCDGLGLLPGRVRRLPAVVGWPHIGWNRLQPVAPPAAPAAGSRLGELFAGLPAAPFAYFVHGYAPDEVPPELVLAACRHGRDFAAAAGRGRVLGTQFHPEKSGALGLDLLDRFLDLTGVRAAGDGVVAAPGTAARRVAPAATEAVAPTDRHHRPDSPERAQRATRAERSKRAEPAGAGGPAERLGREAPPVPADPGSVTSTPGGRVVLAADRPPTTPKVGRPCELFPAIDLRRGQAVRLHQGEATQETVYATDPLAVLAEFAAAGATWVHLVDLDAAFGEPPQRPLLERLLAAAASAGVAVELGGGLRDRAAITWALDHGATRVVLGSLAVRDPAAFAALARELPGRLVPAIESRGGVAQVGGWREGGRIDVATAAARLAGLGCPAVLVTDVERDGTLSGPNLELSQAVATAAGTPVLVSGGVATLADLEAAAASPGVGGVVVGRALYERRFSLREALAAVAGPPGGRVVRVAGAEGSPAVAAEVARSTTALARRVIPCLDVARGRVVKGVRFQALADQGDPAELAARYAAEGADEIVFLDVTAAPERRATDLAWVERTAAQVFVPLTVGGGVRSVEDARRLLLAGADKVGVNTAAVERPELLGELAARFGRQCVVLAVDARRVAPSALAGAAEWAGERGEHQGGARAAERAGEPGRTQEEHAIHRQDQTHPEIRTQPGIQPHPETQPPAQVRAEVPAKVPAEVPGKVQAEARARSRHDAGVSPGSSPAAGLAWEVVVHGGRTATGRDALAWIREAVARGAGEILLTSIDADGTRHGYDLELLAAAVAVADGVPVIASGGVGGLEHLADGLQAGASAVLAASIFHQREVTVAAAKAWLADRGFAIRPPQIAGTAAAAPAPDRLEVSP
jgi:phosphoribosylformimino-5-aminoimidazole carboxamide ribotide isomerase/imidazole glycerol phosphate synthase glutamine amidotransferase subunit